MKYIRTNINKILLCLFILLGSTCSFAQQATTTEFLNGAIVSSENATAHSEHRMANKPYDEYMVGVYYESPTAVHSATRASNPFVSEGIAYVKYNSENGAIKKGDLITSSSTQGEGMKATKSGMVIGVALEDASGTSGLIKIRILIQYVKQ